MIGGFHEFEDGGRYCGGWLDGKANKHGICTGPKGQGHYAGEWYQGFEVSGSYLWQNGNVYTGQWSEGKRNGLGTEKKGRWVYRGEWTHGFKGRFGVRTSDLSGARYEGTWTTGVQDGYGMETYADGGTYSGQWLDGMRHGYGVRQSVPYNVALHYRMKPGFESSSIGPDSSRNHDSIRSDNTNVYNNTTHPLDGSPIHATASEGGRGGFVLRPRTDTGSSTPSVQGSPEIRHRSPFSRDRTSLRKTLVSKLKLHRGTHSVESKAVKSRGVPQICRATKSADAPVRSTVSLESDHSGLTDNTDASFVSQDNGVDASVIETYAGEWKCDKRAGYGVSERSDGLKYEGEWYNNKMNGYGVTTLRDGTKEEGMISVPVYGLIVFDRSKQQNRSKGK